MNLNLILINVLIGIIISLTLSIIAYNFISTRKKRWIIYGSTILSGFCVLLIWPPNFHNERMSFVYSESFFGLSLFVPVFVFFIVVDTLFQTRRLNKNVIDRARNLEKTFGLEIMGLPNEKSKKALLKTHLWYKGMLKKKWNLVLGFEIVNEDPRYKNTIHKEDSHYRKINLFVPSNQEFAVRITSRFNNYDMPEIRTGLTLFNSNDPNFDNCFTIYTTNQSELIHFFQKAKIKHDTKETHLLFNFLDEFLSEWSNLS